MKLIEIRKTKTAQFSLSKENLGKFTILDSRLHVHSDAVGAILERALKDLGLWSDKMPNGYIFGAKDITEIVQDDDRLVFYGISYEAVVK